MEGGAVVPVGDVNTETTSLAVIAFYAEPLTPRADAQPRVVEVVEYALLLALVVVVVLARSAIKKRRPLKARGGLGALAEASLL